MLKISQSLRSITSDFFSIVILFFRPLLGPAICKFPITCTRYAIIQLNELPFYKAIWAIVKRLVRCNPFY